MLITKKIWRYIKNFDTITIFRHVGPDGDAYGSQMGLKHLILSNFPEKKVLCLGKPSAHWETFFDKVDTDVSDELIANSLAIILDTANKARVDDQRFSLAKCLIKIDHHIFVEEFGGVAEWVDTSFIASCEMIARLAEENKLSMPQKAATPLLSGLITDSGRFLYENTTSRTLKLASQLVEDGANMPEIYDFLYQQEEKVIRYKGYLQLNFTITPHGVAYMKNTPEILQRFQMDGGHAGSLVNAMSGIQGVHIHVLFSEVQEGKIKVDFRSKKIPVNTVAAKYGGGGHKLASGALVENWETVNLIIADLDQLCAEAGL